MKELLNKRVKIFFAGYDFEGVVKNIENNLFYLEKVGISPYLRKYPNMVINLQSSSFVRIEILD
ncbi:hypothetical protein KJ750_02025 [Patescibacteria group bacterium]|nr:hypothetical protein [Patescibacteria group bacterium]